MLTAGSRENMLRAKVGTDWDVSPEALGLALRLSREFGRAGQGSEIESSLFMLTHQAR